MKRILFSAAVLCVMAFSAGAQSRNFKLGQWTEIHNAIVRELSRSYVDTLPVDRMQRAAVDAMLSELDPYTVYIPEEDEEDLQMMVNKSYGGIGAVIYKPDVDGNVIISEPYRGTPAEKYGLKCGDEIMEIDGVSVHGLVSQECSDRMKGKPGTTVVFKVKKLRSGEVVDIPVVRERIKISDVDYFGMLDEKTGYVSLGGFTETASSEVKDAFLQLKKQGMEKFVLDLRGNGGGIMQEAVKIVSFFVPKGSLVVSAKGISDESAVSYRTQTEPLDTSIPIIVMVDAGSASASEIVSGALQDLDRATIMGRRTYGKGLVQSIYPLPYNGKIKVTTAKYYTPSGRCVQELDYSRRNADGSIGHIPDSLTREFKTAAGRSVRDGGGITPDVDIPAHRYSRLAFSLVYNGIVEQYALEYVRAHESIPAVRDFHLGDEDYLQFVEYAKGREFDYRSSAKTLFDEMKKELESDGVASAMTSELEALEKAIEMDKETFLKLKKDEIVPLIEEKIVVRYYFAPAATELRIRYDEQLKKALESPLISI